MVSAAGGRAGFVYANQHRRYRALIRDGHSKASAAAISNSYGSGGRNRRARPGRGKRK
jgi:hypothetical protein